ncbi:MAG: aminotransferase class I/II-fold pyridoxal phosphate-dependent enzyme [Acidobacteriota bacterium]
MLNAGDSPGGRRHLHGGDPARDLERFGLEARPVVDFSANLSPLGPPPIVAERWPELLGAVEAYPSLEGSGLEAYYARRFGLDPRRVLAGNGATELIYLLPRVLGLRRAAVLEPAYHDYRRACRAAGCEIVPLRLRPEDGFAPPSDARWREVLGRDLGGRGAVFLGQPNNPTGTLFDPDRLLHLAAAWPQVTFCVDESFIQLTGDFPERSAVFAPGRAEPPPNLVVFHSLTKLYALAGLRLGALIGSPELVARLRSVKEPWTVNALADRLAPELAFCRDPSGEDYEKSLRELLRRERPKLEQALGRLPGLAVAAAPAGANFHLLRRPGGLGDLPERLLARGFCLRDCSNFPGLEGEGGYFRLAVRLPEENLALLAALEACLPPAP